MWCCVSLQAQRHIVYSPEIRSVQVVAGTRWMEMPVIRLNGHEPINISFDELSHTYRRFSYSVIHCEADWTPSEGLFSSDYLTGFQDGLTIDDYEQSINTLLNYTHYHLQLPNPQCRFTMSGNYRVDIRDDNSDDEPLLSVFFMVSEESIPVSLSYSSDTDIDVRKNHQQVSLSLDYSALRPTDPRQQLKGYVLQNGRWDNARWLPMAPRITQNRLEWQHCRDLIFDAGNEYHKFEILDVHRNSLNVENNVWDGEEWHTILWPDYKRSSYVYDETPKGSFYIRNSDNRENNTTSEYVWVHFILKSPPLQLPIYVNGTWTSDLFLPDYEMEYNSEEQQYEAMIPLKYGYYSYQYLCLDGDTPVIPPTEGSFYETNNIYNALIYYRGNADRADRLVGFK